MKNKGFTLVELLAMLVVLGILMGIAIPNIMGMVSNQRKNQIKSDATQMVDNTKVKMAKAKTITKPKNKECIVFSLEYLNYGDNINTGPNGGAYEKYESFVIYARDGQEYKYYVRLLEKTGNNKFFGADIVNINDLKETNTTNIKNIKGGLYGLTKNNNEGNKNTLNSADAVKSICSNGVIAYY